MVIRWWWLAAGVVIGAGAYTLGVQLGALAIDRCVLGV